MSPLWLGELTEEDSKLNLSRRTSSRDKYVECGEGKVGLAQPGSRRSTPLISDNALESIHFLAYLWLGHFREVDARV